MYAKLPDRLDSYLIRIINRYFDSAQQNIAESKESIINEAINRFKEDVLGTTIGNFGVASINSKTGVVTLTAADIGAEPKFQKRTAFNKDFGTTAGTVVEGNDARLSDARTPKAHNHTASEISDLQNAIDTNSKIMALDGAKHGHTNKDVLDKLRYTGTKTTIDLKAIEDLAASTGSSGVTGITEHVNNMDIHVTASQKDSWDAKETTTGAQEKANASLSAAKTYVDDKIADLIGSSPDALNTIYELSAALGDDPSFVTTILNQIADKVSTTLFNTHANDTDIHITAAERTTWNTVTNKANANHNHDDRYYTELEIDNMLDPIRYDISALSSAGGGTSINAVKVLTSGTVSIPLLANELSKTEVIDLSSFNLAFTPKFLAYRKEVVSTVEQFIALPQFKLATPTGAALGFISMISATSTKTELTIQINRASGCPAETVEIQYYILT